MLKKQRSRSASIKKRSPKQRPFHRAIWDDDKRLRRDMLLDSARQLFNSRDFADISVADICRGANVAKGTFYLYFRTKEAAFLAIETDLIADWLEKLRAKLLAKPSKISAAQLTNIIVSSVDEEPDFPKYLCILHSTLEKNVSEEAIVELKRLLKIEMKRTVAVLAQTTKTLTIKSARELLEFVHLCIVGGWQIAHPPPAVQKTIKRPEFAEFRVEFRDLLARHLRAYLHGLMRAGE